MTAEHGTVLASRPTDDRGRVIPWVAGWSSETWGKSLYEPRLRRNALFTLGRQGRGRPVFGALNEPRQRDCMLKGLCQICGRVIRAPVRWLADPSPGTIKGQEGVVVTEPWAHGDCMRYALDHCPGLRDVGELIIPKDWQYVAQIIDPTKAPAKKAARFDPPPKERVESLAREVRRHQGLVGYVRLHVLEHQVIPKSDFMEMYPA